MPRRGFSLIELLVVLAIVAIVAAFSVAALSAQSRAGEIRRNLVTVSGLLDLARQTAVARHTYAYFGMTSPAQAAATHPSAHETPVYLAVFVSNDGSDVLGAGGSLNDQGGPQAEVSLLRKVESLKNVFLDTVLGARNPLVTRLRPPVGSGAALTSSWTLQTSTRVNNAPLSFDRIIKFTPAGAARVSQVPIEVIDLILTPVRGGEQPTEADREISSVIRLSGLTGNVSVYQP
ncbi:MAG: type II secretion system protein [Verrucomicrobium sp.]|nr:type II secretion system protein [Verrucomicrobium sp.]